MSLVQLILLQPRDLRLNPDRPLMGLPARGAAQCRACIAAPIFPELYSKHNTGLTQLSTVVSWNKCSERWSGSPCGAGLRDQSKNTGLS